MAEKRDDNAVRDDAIGRRCAERVDGIDMRMWGRGRGGGRGIGSWYGREGGHFKSGKFYHQGEAPYLHDNQPLNKENIIVPSVIVTVEKQRLVS